MSQISGAQLIVRLLERQGVRTIARRPGGAILPLTMPLSRSERDSSRAHASRAGRGFIAQGMSRISASLGVLASSGPGRHQPGHRDRRCETGLDPDGRDNRPGCRCR